MFLYESTLSHRLKIFSFFFSFKYPVLQICFCFFIVGTNFGCVLQCRCWPWLSSWAFSDDARGIKKFWRIFSCRNVRTIKKNSAAASRLCVPQSLPSLCHPRLPTACNFKVSNLIAPQSLPAKQRRVACCVKTTGSRRTHVASTASVRRSSPTLRWFLCGLQQVRLVSLSVFLLNIIQYYSFITWNVYLTLERRWIHSILYE